MYSVDEVVESCGGAIFDAEVVDYKGKLDPIGGMCKETRDMGIFDITLSGEVLDEMLL